MADSIIASSPTTAIDAATLISLATTYSSKSFNFVSKSTSTTTITLPATPSKFVYIRAYVYEYSSGTGFGISIIDTILKSGKKFYFDDTSYVTYSSTSFSGISGSINSVITIYGIVF